MSRRFVAAMDKVHFTISIFVSICSLPSPNLVKKIDFYRNVVVVLRLFSDVSHGKFISNIVYFILANRNWQPPQEGAKTRDKARWGE